MLKKNGLGFLAASWKARGPRSCARRAACAFRLRAPGPRTSPEPRAPSPDLLSVLSRRPGPRASVAGGPRPQHRVRGALSGHAAVRAREPCAARAAARGTIDGASRVRRAAPRVSPTGVATRRSPHDTRSIGLLPACGPAASRAERSSGDRRAFFTPPNCSCPGWLPFVGAPYGSMRKRAHSQYFALTSEHLEPSSREAPM